MSLSVNCAQTTPLTPSPPASCCFCVIFKGTVSQGDIKLARVTGGKSAAESPTPFSFELMLCFKHRPVTAESLRVVCPHPKPRSCRRRVFFPMHVSRSMLLSCTWRWTGDMGSGQRGPAVGAGAASPSLSSAPSMTLNRPGRVQEELCCPMVLKQGHPPAHQVAQRGRDTVGAAGAGDDATCPRGPTTLPVPSGG